MHKRPLLSSFCFALFSLLPLPRVLSGQQVLPVLKAHSVSVDVREGKNFYKGYWTVSPGLKKDIYYAHRFQDSNTITFITDSDSLSFRVKPGQSYGFIILLNGKDSAYTEISTLRETYHKLPGQLITTDTIPFALGHDNRIYITGRINHSEPLRFFFDNGADNTIVFPSALQKGLKVQFDDSVQNNGTGGSATRQTSNTNHVELSKLIWENELVMYVGKQLGDHADGTIGYDLFEDKIVEIDFDKMILVIHDRPYRIPDSFERFDMNLNGGDVPFLATTLVIGKDRLPKLFMFDMGATGCLFLNQRYSARNDLYSKMKVIGEGSRSGAGDGSLKTQLMLLPELLIGKSVLSDLPVNVQLADAANGSDAEELGMDVLTRFNIVLDYQNNFIYLKPNHSYRSPYRQRGSN